MTKTQTSQHSKKTSSAASKKGAVLDLAAKKQGNDEAFRVQPLHLDDEVPVVEPLDEAAVEHDSYQADPVLSYEEPYAGQPYSNEPVLHEHQPVQRRPLANEEPKQDEEPFKDPKDYVKVSFGKFVQLVANHDFDKVIKNNENEEVILSSNLLADLASAHDQEEGKKIPLVFIIGLAIGVVLTYILLSK